MAVASKKNLSGPKTIPKGKTKEDLLRVTVAAIDEVGEAHVRLEDVLRDANASVSSLYHHFGNMRGLLDEAQLARFNATSGQNVRDFVTAANRVKNKKEMKQLVISTVRDAYSSDRAKNRMASLNAFASILETPHYSERVAQAEQDSINLLRESLETLRARDLISPTLDLNAFSTWMMGLRFSRVVPDMVNDPAVEEAWIAITTKAVLHLLEL